MHEGSPRRARRALTLARLEPSLVDASRLLAAAADERAILRALTRLTVPGLAEACVIDVLDDEHSVRRFGHALTGRGARELTQRAPLDPDGPYPFSRVIRTRQVERTTRLLAVPLIARGQPLGVLTLLAGPTRAFAAADVTIVEDLAARGALALDNVRMARAARDASGARDETLATLSHELRNAMNSILGWAQVLRTLDVTTPLAARALDAVERNTHLQAQLIDDLFDVSRIASGKFAIDLVALDLAAIAGRVVEDSHPAAAARGVHLSSHLTPVRVRGDARRLHQVVANLMSNALKFSEPGGWVRVDVTSAGARAELRVTDSGRGIAPDLLPHVFDRFRQGAGARATGLGLGLAIVRSIVEMHGGEVQAESGGTGKGAILIVTLPRLSD